MDRSERKSTDHNSALKLAPLLLTLCMSDAATCREKPLPQTDGALQSGVEAIARSNAIKLIEETNAALLDCLNTIRNGDPVPSLPGTFMFSHETGRIEACIIDFSPPESCEPKPIDSKSITYKSGNREAMDHSAAIDQLVIKDSADNAKLITVFSADGKELTVHQGNIGHSFVASAHDHDGMRVPLGIHEQMQVSTDARNGTKMVFEAADRRLNKLQAPLSKSWSDISAEIGRRARVTGRHR